MRRFQPAAVVLAAFLFYVATLAPGLLWGDSAKFQRMAWQGELRFDETGHPLWVLLAHPLTRVPGLDPARACNLLSAILSAAALWPAYRIMRRLSASPTASTLACLALAVSHTYWFHAVAAEVYALNSLVTLVLLDRILLMEEKPAPTWRWLAIGMVAGLAAGNHLLVLLWLPGFLWWSHVASGAGRASRMSVVLLAAGFALGIVPFALLRAVASRAGSFPALAERLVRGALTPSHPAGDALQFAGYLLYQFPVPLMLAAAVAGAIRLRRERPADRIGLVILYVTNVLFAFSYQVPDRFAFYLPSYLLLALLAAPGLDMLFASFHPRGAVVALAVAALVVAPPIVYGVASDLVGPRLLGRFPSARALPGRDPVAYYLYPGKAGDESARRFCLDALSGLPPSAMLLADYTLHEPLDYMQLAGGLRPDVEVLYALPQDQLEVALVATKRSRRVYIAARDSFYDVAALSTRFDIRPAGPVFELVPRSAPEP